MTKPALRGITSLLLTGALVMTAAAHPVLGAKADKKKDKKQDPEPSAVIEVLKGDKYRMASTKMADRVVRIEDGIEDQVTTTGDPVVGAPGHSDIVAVYVAATEMPKKLLTKMAKDFPAGTAGSFYGNDAAWSAKKNAIFVAAKLADKRPVGAPGQQLEIAIDGDAATPVQVASAGDPLAGVERFSLSGIFNNGSWSSGTTDVSGREPGGEIDWYNATSGNFGFYDPKRATYYVVLPRPKDAQSVTVALRTSTAAGEVIDRLELPDGGSFVSLGNPSGGFSAKAGLDPLGCRALETYSGASTDPAPLDSEATLIRYTAGTGTSDPSIAAELLAPALEAAGTIPMLLTEVGSDPEEVEPLEVDGEFAVAPGGDAVTLTMEVPPGRWSFEPAEGAQIELPNGEPLIDHASLTGSAGILTGPGLDGVVAGDPTCTPPPGDVEAADSDAESPDSDAAATDGDADASPDAATEAVETDPEG